MNTFIIVYQPMLQILRNHIEEIIPLSNDEFLYISNLFTTKTYKKNEFLIREGSSVKYAYFVESGLLQLIFIDYSGKEHIVSFAMENWWETDFAAYFTQSKATMSLQCIEDTTVYCLPLAHYQQICVHIQKMESFFLQKANAGFIAAQQRILSLLTTDAKERYEQLLTRYPALFQRVSKTRLASFLGVSRETLSRLNT